MPPEKSSGERASTIIKVEAMTTTRTSAIPSIVAMRASFPMRRWRSTEWMSMMLSSTRRPIDRSIPIRVPELKVIPKGTIIRMAMASEVGTVTRAIRVPRHSPRKSRTARPVKNTARPNSCQTFWKRMSTKRALS